jgi:hypothetical protein
LADYSHRASGCPPLVGWDDWSDNGHRVSLQGRRAIGSPQRRPSFLPTGALRASGQGHHPLPAVACAKPVGIGAFGARYRSAHRSARRRTPATPEQGPSRRWPWCGPTTATPLGSGTRQATRRTTPSCAPRPSARRGSTTASPTPARPPTAASAGRARRASAAWPPRSPGGSCAPGPHTPSRPAADARRPADGLSARGRSASSTCGSPARRSRSVVARRGRALSSSRAWATRARAPAR